MDICVWIRNLCILWLLTLLCLTLVYLNFFCVDKHHGQQSVISLLYTLQYYWIYSFLSVWQEECQNYIRVLLVGGNHLFTCGTNAFTPICTNRTVRVKCFAPQAEVPVLSQQIKRQGMLWLTTGCCTDGWADV